MKQVTHPARLLVLLVVLLVALAAAPAGRLALAAGEPPYKKLTNITDPETSKSNRDAISPRLAFDSTRQRYLLIYASDGIDPLNPNNEYQIYGQLLSASLRFLDPANLGGTPPRDPTPFRISATASRDLPGKPSRDPNDGTFRPSLAYNSVSRSYLVVWSAVKTRGAADDEYEIFGRIINDGGQPVGAEFQISDQGPAGDLSFDATDVAVVANPAADGEFLVVWRGDTPASTELDHEYEIYGRRISAAGAPIGAPFRITTFGPDNEPTYDTDRPFLAANTNRGDYMLVYPATTIVGDRELYGQRIAADGSLIGGESQLTDMGPEGDSNYKAYQGAMAFNPDSDEYLVVFPGVDLVLGETEIYGQRLDADGVEVGLNDFRISDMGTYGSPRFHAFVPDVAYSTFSREYMVIWQGDDTFDGDRDMFAQRLAANGAAIGADDQRLSYHGIGPNGDYNSSNYTAGSASIAYSAPNDLFTMVWNSDDGVDVNTGTDIISTPDPFFGLVEDEYETFGRQFGIFPTLRTIDTVPPSSGGTLDEIEGVDEAITGLTITFSKPMANPAGDSEPGDVTNPANYRLLEAGTNRQAETDTCGALEGDDQEVSLSGVSYAEATRTATLNLSPALAPNFYRLILCGSLRDNRGNSFDGNDNGIADDEDQPRRYFTRDFSTLSASAQPWLVLLYLAGDDIDPTLPPGTATPLSLSEPLQRMLGRLAGMPYNANARIVVLYDGSRQGDSRIYVREPTGLVDVTDDVAASPIWPGFPADSELDTGSITTLEKFIRWARTSYPGTRYSMLSVVNHGGGWAPDLNDLAQPRGRLVVQSGGWRGMSLDLGAEGGTSFSTRETGEILDQLGALGRFNLIFYDACLMGMVESAYEVQPYTDYFIGGQNLLWAALPYDRYLSTQNLSAATTPRQLTERIVTLYNAGAPGGQPFSIAAVESAGLVDVVGLSNALGQYLHGLLLDTKTAAQTEAAIRRAYAAAQKFDYDASFVIDPTDGYIDLAHFAAQLRTVQISRDGVDVAGNVRGIADALSKRIVGGGELPRAVIKLRVVSGTFRLPGRAPVMWNFDNSNGLSVYLPLGERDIRRTGEPAPQALAGPLAQPQLSLENQLDYYKEPNQLAFTRDAGPWAAMIAQIDPRTPLRAGDRDYTSPFPLADVRIYLPLLRR